MSKTKTIKAWAVVNRRGKIKLLVFVKRHAVEACGMWGQQERVVPVTVTWEEGR